MRISQKVKIAVRSVLPIKYKPNPTQNPHPTYEEFNHTYGDHLAIDLPTGLTCQKI